jgi:hypothetical protein
MTVPLEDREARPHDYCQKPRRAGFGGVDGRIDPPEGDYLVVFEHTAPSFDQLESAFEVGGEVRTQCEKAIAPFAGRTAATHTLWWLHRYPDYRSGYYPLVYDQEETPVRPT